jgi:FkbM family methyltransferase
MMKIPQPKLNVIELTMIGVLVAILGCFAGALYVLRLPHPFLALASSEVQELADRYGPARSSENGEEWIIRDFFQDRRGGVFVDVGANHYQRFSNTYYLETQLGWSGLAIEPQTKFAADYAVHRPRTTFVPLFVSDVSNSEAVLYVSNDLAASSNRDFTEARSAFPSQSVNAKTATLDDILNRNGIKHIDFLSIDIELHEPQALRGFSIDRFRPRLVAIEAHLPVRQQILDYFATHGYVVIGKYLRADVKNLWFAPSGGADPVAQR